MTGLGLLAVAFAASAVRVLTRRENVAMRGSEVTLRFAHVSIHPGVIRAYDRAIRDYERLHPGIHVEQVPVPLRLWGPWLRTQMIGGTAPDLADMDRGQNDEFLARYFQPLDAWLSQPNPYNSGTDLSATPW